MNLSLPLRSIYFVLILSVFCTACSKNDNKSDNNENQTTAEPKITDSSKGTGATVVDDKSESVVKNNGLETKTTETLEKEEKEAIKESETSNSVSVAPVEVNKSVVLPEPLEAVEINRLFNEMLEDLAHKEFAYRISYSEQNNFVISPPGSLIITGMLNHASSGQTATKIQTDLGWSPIDFALLPNWSSSFNPNIEWNTSTWGQTEYLFADGYVNSLSTLFNSEFSSVDFYRLDSVAAREVDLWLPESYSSIDATINNALNSINTRTRLVFGNKFELDIDLAASLPGFELTEGLWQDETENQEKIPVLKVQGTFPTYNTDTFKSVKIPLADNSLALTVIMPTKEGFTETEAGIREILANKQAEFADQEIEFMLPVFNIKSSSNIGSLVSDGKYYDASTITTSSCSTDAISAYTFCALSPLTNGMTSDYSTVNDAGFLYRASFSGESSISFSDEGISSKAVTMAMLNATVLEPVSLFTWGEAGSGYYSVDGSSYMTSTVWRNDFVIMDPCTPVYEVKGPTQVRPFIFVISDVSTNHIVQMGRVSTLDGEYVGKQVCQSEKIEYEDNIWPLVADVQSVETISHVLSNEYVIKDIIPNQDNIIWSVGYLNHLLLKSFATADVNEKNYLSSPANEFVVSMMSKMAEPDLIMDEWLVSQGELVSRTDLKNTFQLGANVHTAIDNKFWIQTDYKVKSIYLDFLANSSVTDISVVDFFNNTKILKTEVTDWLDKSVSSEFDLGKLIGNRTRLLFGSAFSSMLEMTGKMSTGNFANEDGIYIDVPVVKIEGNYGFYADEKLKAVEIIFNNDELLVLMPGKSFFVEVQRQLSEYIDNVTSNLSVQHVSITLPTFSLHNVDKKIENTVNELSNNASEVRPLLPLSQYSSNSVIFDESGLNQKAYSLNALVAPADNGTVAGFSSGWDGAYAEQSLFSSDCMASLNQIPIADSRSFIFVLRDKSSHLIRQVGRVQNIESGQLICEPDNINKNSYWPVIQ